MDGVEYAYARLCARHGQRPDAAAWHRIEHARTLRGVLDAARATPLERDIAGLADAADAHAVEALLRRRFRALVGEVAAWMPARWREAVRWCAVLPDLPILGHAARAGDRPRWMRDDPWYRDVVDGAPGASSPFAPLAAAWTAPDRLADAWYREYRSRVPGGDSGPLDAIESAIRRHLAAFRDPGLADGTALRRRLEGELATLFRRASLSPAAAFAFLALALLDLERLRGELLRRVVFPGRALAA